MHILINSFFQYNIHLGHSIKSTILLAAWSLFGFRRQVWFINILKTLYFLRLALKLISFLVTYHFPIWFVHIDKSLKTYMDSLAMRACEFSCTSAWIRGMLSNFKQVVYTHSVLRTKFLLKLSQRFKKFKHILVLFFFLVLFDREVYSFSVL